MYIYRAGHSPAPRAIFRIRSPRLTTDRLIGAAPTRARAEAGGPEPKDPTPLCCGGAAGGTPSDRGPADGCP